MCIYVPLNRFKNKKAFNYKHCIVLRLYLGIFTCIGTTAVLREMEEVNADFLRSSSSEDSPRVSADAFRSGTI